MSTSVPKSSGARRKKRECEEEGYSGAVRRGGVECGAGDGATRHTRNAAARRSCTPQREARHEMCRTLRPALPARMHDNNSAAVRGRQSSLQPRPETRSEEQGTSAYTHTHQHRNAATASTAPTAEGGKGLKQVQRNGRSSADGETEAYTDWRDAVVLLAVLPSHCRSARCERGGGCSR